MALPGLPQYAFLFSIYYLTALSGSTCFFPNGDIHELGSPCNPSANVSFCCESTHTCLSNKLCFDTHFNHVIRGSCTDSTYPDSCSNLCMTDSTGALSGSIADLRECNNDNVAWVCSRNVTDCTNSFQIPFGYVEDYRPFPTNNILADGPSTTTSSGSATAYVSTVTVTASTLSSSSTKGVATTTVTTSAEPTDEGFNSAALGAGLGVGLPLLIALLVSLWFLFRARKLVRELKSAPVPEQKYVMPPPQDPTQDSTMMPLPYQFVHEAGSNPIPDRQELGE